MRTRKRRANRLTVIGKKRTDYSTRGLADRLYNRLLHAGTKVIFGRNGCGGERLRGAEDQGSAVAPPAPAGRGVGGPGDPDDRRAAAVPARGLCGPGGEARRPAGGAQLRA